MKRDDFTDQAQELKEQAQETAGQFKDKVQDWQRKAKQGAQKAAESAGDYVQDNPWTVIGSVALACVLLGFFFGRSRD